MNLQSRKQRGTSTQIKCSEPQDKDKKWSRMLHLCSVTGPEVEMVRLSWWDRQSLRTRCGTRSSCTDACTSFLSSNAPRLLRCPKQSPWSPPLFFRPSVETLASALVPVAVDHQADDHEEDAAQQGEQHGEKDGYSTHPFFILAHWKRRSRKEEVSQPELQSKC